MQIKPRPRVLGYDATNVKSFGPSRIEHRTAEAGFGELGVFFQEFPDGGHSDEWTLTYEEAIFVISGEASILVAEHDGAIDVRAGTGSLIAVPRGATVKYGGEPGTRLLLAISPVNRRDRDPESASHKRPARVLFLTPFNFENPEHDEKFDAIISGLMAAERDVLVVADHVERFPAAEDYERAQTEAVLKAVQKAGADMFDAIVVACHYDPAVPAARSAAQVPVVGPLQLTTGLATQFGPRFAVITDVQEAEAVIADLLAGYGYRDSCVGVTAIGWTGDDILEDTSGAAHAVDRLVATIAEEGRAQSVVIGCTIASAAYELHRHELPDRGIPVLNSNLITVKGAAALATH